MQSLRMDFPGAAGHTLSARLDTPDGPVRAHALFAHCYTCGKDAIAARRIAQALTGHGIAVLRFDFAGLGASEGKFEDSNFSSNVADLLAAVAHLRAQGIAPRLMIGHSLGGTAVLAAAGQVPEVTALVTIAAPSEPKYLLGLFEAHREQIQADGAAEVQLAGRPFQIQRHMLEDAASHVLKGKIATLKRALMVMHAPGDDTVEVSNAMAIFTAAKHPKSFVSLDDADHLLTRKPDAVYVANLIAAWSARYL